MARVDMNVVSHIIEKRASVVRQIINAAGEGMAASTQRTPFKGGQLRGNRRVIPKVDGARMEWGTRYAAVQNVGARRGARPFTNYTTPGTGRGFAEIAIQVVRARLKAGK